MSSRSRCSACVISWYSVRTDPPYAFRRRLQTSSSTCDLSIVIVSWNVADLLGRLPAFDRNSSRPAAQPGRRHFGPI